MNLGVMELGSLGAGLVVLAALLWFLLRGRQEREAREDAYTRGLELWLDGDRKGAVDAMRQAVDNDPDGFDPYHQLGNFLRQTGDPRRAAALHRSLTARTGLDAARKRTVALALAEDLVALEQWGEAGQILTELQKRRPDGARFWRVRFRQLHGSGDQDAAAAALKAAAKRLDGDDSARMRADLAVYQLDRALRAVRDGRSSAGRRLVKEALAHGAASSHGAYVLGQAALAEENPEQAAETVTSGLLENPDAADLLLPVLQKALLASGRYERTVPILESACQSASAPPSLWVALALLHEKLGDREQAVRLLEGKLEDDRLDLAAMAPFLRNLVHDLPDCDFKRLWLGVGTRPAPKDRSCPECGHQSHGLHWCCPACLAFDPSAVEGARP